MQIGVVLLAEAARREEAMRSVLDRLRDPELLTTAMGSRPSSSIALTLYVYVWTRWGWLMELEMATFGCGLGRVEREVLVHT